MLDGIVEAAVSGSILERSLCSLIPPLTLCCKTCREAWSPPDTFRAVQSNVKLET
jgi:hypothetical protein